MLQDVLDLENRSLGANGEPTLAAAYEILKEQWRNGDRDREVGLHLMFLAWYGIIEPEHLTGFSKSDMIRLELNQMFSEVHAFFEPQIVHDAEMLYAFGLAGAMFWFMLNDDKIWEQRAKDYRKAYRALQPNGLDPRIFDNRGAYGYYSAGQCVVNDGY